jgi:FkbM family methyltransferase
MPSKYFILTKSSTSKVDDNEENQIVQINRPMSFILPSTNLSYYYSHGLFESSLMEWAKQFCSKEKVFLDIGAHTGTYSICLAPLVKHVISFEPQVQTYYALCGSVALSNLYNVTCMNIALGDKTQTGVSKLLIRSEDGGGSSLLPIDGATIIGEENVNVETLDSYQLSNIGFIKIDVEFNEINVLKGAVETLKRNNLPTLLFESNTENKELFDFIVNDLGYSNISNISGTQNMFIAVSSK